MDSINKYQPVIGLEVHAQLSTKSKIFSSDPAAFGAEPNTQVSIVSLAHPGTLPKLNKTALEYAIKIGLACHSEISRFVIFDRKNYFYPDLPKGYQITQDRTPICRGGYVTINSSASEKNIQLNRIHLEEDAGKSIHTHEGIDTQIDFNRAGIPLIEIVTEPVINSSEDAAAFLTEVRKLVRYLNICDGNMEEGSLRCDANVSVMPAGSTKLGKKVEIKNMNSIRNVQRAIDTEIERQIALIEHNQSVVSETRLYNADSGETRSMRTKEELNDYRYFPDPDLSPLVISDTWLETVKKSMPKLPRQLYQELTDGYQLPPYDAQVLTETRQIAEYFLEICRHTKLYKAASNWVMGPIKAQLNELSVPIEQFSVQPRTIARLIALIDEGKLSFANASQVVLQRLIENPSADPLTVAQELNVVQVSDQVSILGIIEEVLTSYPEKVAEYRKGKKAIVTMFMGEVMKRSKGKADPQLTQQLIIEKLGTF